MSLTQLVNSRLPSEPDQTTVLWVEDGFFISANVVQEGNREADQVIDLHGQLIMPSLVETHIHLDKACILHRCQLNRGTLQEAIAQTTAAKRDFTEDDVYARGKQVIEQAIVQGTGYMRTHVEIDPVIGLTGFQAVRRLQADFAWAMDIEICVFPQEGMLNNPGTEILLLEALAAGAQVLGGCPYTDSDPAAQIRRLFEIAVEYDRDLDFHLDFDLYPERSLMPVVLEQTRHYGWAQRVTVGHVTSLSALPAEALQNMAEQLAAAGVSVTALPSTDLFLSGRDCDCLVPRGVAPLHRLAPAGVQCSISTNNMGNPFTPFGDASLVRQANLFANLAQLGTNEAYRQCLQWVTSESARILRLPNYGLEPGCQADFIGFSVARSEHIVTQLAIPNCGFKRGVEVFRRPAVQLFSPDAQV